MIETTKQLNILYVSPIKDKTYQLVLAVVLDKLQTDLHR